MPFTIQYRNLTTLGRKSFGNIVLIGENVLFPTVLYLFKEKMHQISHSEVVVCTSLNLDKLRFFRLTQGRRHNSADSAPTSNLVSNKEVTIRITFCSAGIIYYRCILVNDIQCTRYENAVNKHFSRIVYQNNSAKIYSQKILTVCHGVYFRL